MSSNKRSVLVTGCSKNSAGHALALEFASRGLRVFATARSLSSLEGLQGHGIETLTLDVSKSESIEALKKEIATRTGGKLDILFNNAGSLYEAPAVEQDPSRVRQMFESNVFGVMEMISTFTPLLLAAKAGSSLPPTIVNTASIVAVLPYMFASAYAASKAAIAAYSNTLRLEVAPLGIKVVTLYMGVVSTNLFSADGVQFGPDSWYVEVETGVKKRNQDSTATGMKIDQFAKAVVGEIVSNPGLGKGEWIWKGAKANLVWFLNTFGPRKVFDGTMEGDVGFTREVKEAVAKRGEASLSKQG
ncbi:NADPH-dependent 1-acyldihydroxyacetone phosphate reductase [Cercospora beticola]|uniref:NADPH-dependent 1-acyldihydroxyacetone phosphate reductase n=1 Tax=Cercospora beticola TaxID=122368 RepID=A0A2G5I5P3_CERBT|nr:NADPH-dependent 1-acyldihydroxyacetone phosphate reductase [Cercospora beticola]PIB00127.1 NADPH-dependent 1-acyldihydroxyacetone phosphate reductase [Cercospora beticola]WPB00080.1 hypothetical protein RHO25_004699 [Cercospora beticola]CAK1361737.1 unnamed protein product [Cercospora beticola]